MRPIAELCAEVDQALQQVSLQLTNDGFVNRRYEGTLDGRPLRSALSLFVDTGNPTRLTSGQATGYQLSLEYDNGLPTRWVMGQDVSVLLRAGLTRVANVTPKALLRADDTAWAGRFLSPEVKPAFTQLAEVATFMEQRPGVVQLQVRRFGDTTLPPLLPLLHAFAAVARASQQAPAPRPSKARLADNRGLMMLLITLAVLATFGTCLVLGYSLLPY